MPVITFHSYKGGCGRSVGLANVAFNLALRGKRVACIDMDIESAGLLSIFDIDTKSKYNIIDLLINPDSTPLNETVINYKAEKSFFDMEGELYIIGAEVDEDTERISLIPESIGAANIFKDYTLKMIEATYQLDYILIDTRSGLCNNALFVNLRSDCNIIFSRIDRQCQKGTKRILDTLEDFKIQGKKIVVCNGIPDHPGISDLLAIFKKDVGAIDIQIPYNPGLVIEEKIVFQKEFNTKAYAGVKVNYDKLSDLIMGVS